MAKAGKKSQAKQVQTRKKGKQSPSAGPGTSTAGAAAAEPDAATQPVLAMLANLQAELAAVTAERDRLRPAAAPESATDCAQDVPTLEAGIIRAQERLKEATTHSTISVSTN